MISNGAAIGRMYSEVVCVCVELGGMYVNGHTGNYVTVLHFFCTNNPHADEIRVKVGFFFGGRFR